MVKQFVVDFTSKTYKPLMEHEVNGLDYRYVYSDKARLSVVIQGIENGSASLLDANGELHAYYHCDYLGTTDYLTSAVNSKVISWTSYNEWGEITHNAVLKCGQRELDLVKRYATHDYDQVLGMYYAKARFYDASNRRFMAVDPVKGTVTNPMTMVQYLYVLDNPLTNIDPTGKVITPANVVGALIGALGGYVIGVAVADYFELHGCFRDLAIGGTTGLLTVVGWFSGPAVYAAIKPLVVRAIQTGQIIIDKTTTWIMNALGISKAATIGTSFGKLGTLIANDGKRVVDWANVTTHGMQRMSERGVTQAMVDTWVRTGKALQQSNTILYVTRQGAVVLNRAGQVVTAYTSKYFDANMQAVIKQLFG